MKMFNESNYFTVTRTGLFGRSGSVCVFQSKYNQVTNQTIDNRPWFMDNSLEAEEQTGLTSLTGSTVVNKNKKSLRGDDYV